MLVDTEEHPRADSNLEALGKLRPTMGGQDDQATVTAGNASGQNDGATVCVVTAPQRAAKLGLRPLARLVAWSVAGVCRPRWASGRSWRPSRSWSVPVW